jgi:MFS family permease
LLGLTIAVGGVGSLLGAALARPMGKTLGPGPAIVLATVGSAASVFLIPFAHGPLALRAGMMMGAQLVGDTLGTAVIIIAVSLRQTILPRQLLGRSAGVLTAGAGASGILGSLTAGALATAVGPRNTLLIAAIGYGVIPLIAILSPLMSVKALPRPDL